MPTLFVILLNFNVANTTQKKAEQPKAILPLVAEYPQSVIAHTLDAIAKATQREVSINPWGYLFRLWPTSKVRQDSRYFACAVTIADVSGERIIQETGTDSDLPGLSRRRESTHLGEFIQGWIVSAILERLAEDSCQISGRQT